jgi:hypothetical protein
VTYLNLLEIEAETPWVSEILCKKRVPELAEIWSQSLSVSRGTTMAYKLVQLGYVLVEY